MRLSERERKANDGQQKRGAKVKVMRTEEVTPSSTADRQNKKNKNAKKDCAHCMHEEESKKAKPRNWPRTAR